MQYTDSTKTTGTESIRSFDNRLRATFCGLALPNVAFEVFDTRGLRLFRIGEPSGAPRPKKVISCPAEALTSVGLRQSDSGDA